MTIDRRREVRAAKDIYERRHTFDAEMTERAVRLLAEHKDADGRPLWSMAQVALFTGAKPTLVRRVMSKTDHSGGRINPASLDLLLEMIALNDRNERNTALVAKIIDDGTSSYMVAKLVGRPVATVKWLAAQYRKTAGAAA
jgi:hypothetical protein